MRSPVPGPFSGSGSARTDHAADEEMQDPLSPHVGLDERGRVTYHGPTSRFSVGTVSDAQLNVQPDSHSTPQIGVATAGHDVDMMAQVWQPLLESETEADLGAPPDMVQRLLKINWM